MYSIDFPEMFTYAATNLLSDEDANRSNMELVLMSWKNSLFGDPYFGSNLKRFIYEQNNVILRDLVIDDIYVCLQQFIPQILVERNDIIIKSDGDCLFATIKYTNIYDKTVNMYQIDLMSKQ